MSERSSRPGREEIKAQRKETKRAQKILREEQKNEGLTPRSHTTISNRKSEFESVEEEQKARNDALSEQVRIIRSKLPVLLKPLSKIEDPRNPKKTKHKLTVLMLYEILAFVFQMSSLRETEHCRDNNWQYMIVLKDKELPTVMEEFEALSGLEPNNWKTHTWGNRRQSFRWANQIEYCYGPNGRQKEIVHVVECNEEWEEVDKVSSQIVTKTAHHMWLSNKPLDKWNLHERCNLGARSRWSIENGILVEKHHGYQYEHCFSYDWNAMRGYHYLMRLAHLFNTLSHYSQHLAKVIRDTGVRGFIRFIRETMAGRWLDYEWLEDRLREPFQLRIT
jgi:hypothetical protein